MSSKVSSPSQSNQSVDAYSVRQQEQAPRRRQNPEKLAWSVLLVSFAIFIALAVAIPLGIKYTIRYFSVAQSATLESTLGTVFLYPSASAAEPVAIIDTRENLQEGSRIIIADDSTQGTLGIVGDEASDELLGSIQLYAGSELEILRLRRPYFARSVEPYSVRLRIEQGQARLFTKSGDRRPLRIVLETPHGEIDVKAGSYKISVQDDVSEITVRSGEATLNHLESGTITISDDQRAWMSAETIAENPTLTEQNLIRNGDFADSVNEWSAYSWANGVEPGIVRLIERDGRRAAQFIRQGEENVHTEIGLIQQVDRDVNVYDSLTIQLDVRLMHQSVAGGGDLNSEFPLRVEIEYTDIYGKDLRWGHGFYFRDPETPDRAVVGGQKISPFTWYTYESPNLMELLQDTRPARISSLRVYASGHNYQSMVGEIYMVAE